MALTKKVRQIIENDPVLLGKIAAAVGRKSDTVMRWARDNHENLTMAASIDAITEHTGLTREQILEPVKA